MSANATGTPTSLGIPTLNINQDKNVGTGVNEIVTAIDGIVKTNIPRRTVSTLAGGPPGSPSDGDEWIATAVDGSGTRWHFQYNAGSASAYKWEFLGGSSVVVSINTNETTTTINAFVDTATAGPSFTVVRPGDYDLRGNALCYNPAAADVISISWAKNGVVFGDLGSAAPYAVNKNQSMSVLARAAATAAADVLSLKVQVGVSGNGWQHRDIRVLPVRIS